MLTILDKYILKQYLSTFSVMLLLFIPIGITIDVSEKVNKMIENKVPFVEIATYYGNFVIYFANLLFPIFLFLSIIWFTSKLANKTEIIAILSSGISFTRFLRPYLISAAIVSVIALAMGIFIVPKASEGFQNFRYTNLVGNGRQTMRKNDDVFKQIGPETYMHVGSFSQSSQMGFKFTLEKFKGQKLQYKIFAERIKWNARKTNYTMFEYQKRIVGEFDDVLVKAEKKDTVFNFDIEDLTPTIYVAETLPLTELTKFIDKESKRGSSNINAYKVALYKKFSIPISAFILTIIAVAVASRKRRGGMGINLAIGIGVAFGFIFIDKIFGVLGEKSSVPPLLAAWTPNIVFSFLAIFLLKKSMK